MEEDADVVAEQTTVEQIITTITTKTKEIITAAVVAVAANHVVVACRVGVVVSHAVVVRNVVITINTTVACITCTTSPTMSAPVHAHNHAVVNARSFVQADALSRAVVSVAVAVVDTWTLSVAVAVAVLHRVVVMDAGVGVGVPAPVASLTSAVVISTTFLQMRKKVCTLIQFNAITVMI